jgi:hypothetical protein
MPMIHSHHPAFRCLTAAALAGALAACGSTSEDPGGPDAGAQVDAVPAAPVVMVSPADGERGVRVTDPIVLTFSEPMNTASVEAAWTSTSLPLDMLQLDWNPTGTILILDASAVLEYPAGDENVDVYSYEFTLEASAVDLDGDALSAPVQVSFNTARDVTMQLARIAATTGSHDGNAVGADIRVGDTQSNGTWQGFITVDLSALPEVVELTSASLFARQTDVVGLPYTDLGDLQLVQLAPLIAIDAAAYSAAPVAELGVFSDSTAIASPGGDRSLDVTAAIAADLADGSPVSSFRLQFDDAHDQGTDDDHVIFDPTSVRLDVRVLAE